MVQDARAVIQPATTSGLDACHTSDKDAHTGLSGYGKEITELASSHKIVRYAVHPAVSMAQAIFENLEEKTGRSMEQWVAELTRGGPADTKERLRWLKTKHGLGGTTARLVVDRADGGAG